MELSFCLNGCLNREVMVRADVSCTIFCKCNKWIGRTGKILLLFTRRHPISERRGESILPRGHPCERYDRRDKVWTRVPAADAGIARER